MVLYRIYMKRFRIDIELTVKIIFLKLSGSYFAFEQNYLNFIVVIFAADERIFSLFLLCVNIC